MAAFTLVVELLLAPAVLALAAFLVNIARGIHSRLTKQAKLRSVHGPTPTSLLAGSLHELYDVGGLPYLEALSEYGGVAKVHGLFGVRRSRNDQGYSCRMIVLCLRTCS